MENWQRDNYYRTLVETGDDKMFSDETALRLVILVRDDILPPIHQGIQAMHSVIALASQAGMGKIDPRCYLILLGATAEQIATYSAKIDARYKKIYAMYSDPGLVEPDSETSPVTACAFEPMTADEVRLYFAGLRRAS